MRLLILGGTAFLGRAVARAALAAGHDVTCAARGLSGDPVAGTRFVRVDRDDPAGLADLTGEFDAMVDLTRRPDHVRHAVRALADRVDHVTFVSTVSVYSDTATSGQRADTAAVLPPASANGEDPTRGADGYGRCKVSCERLYLDGFGAEHVFICRAGLIVGPEDPSGRFAYWVRRAARGGEVLVPGTPDDSVQFVDVRDLAEWIVDSAGRRTGVFDGVAAPISRRDFLAGVFAADAEFCYVSQDFLLAHEVAPWSGPRSLPLWVPVPEYAGFMNRDVRPALAAGLRTRPLAETARDTAAWLAAGGAGNEVGLTEAEEADLLKRWRAR